MGTTSLLVALAPRLGGFGVPKFFSGSFRRRGGEVLKAHAPFCGVFRKLQLALCIRTGFRPSRDTAFLFQRRGQHADAG